MQYTVKQGDCLSSIAHRFGFCDWHVLWDHPSNAAFKAKRKNPNIIYPGDVLFIPVKEPKLEDCPTEQRHTFQLTVPGTRLRLVLKDQQGQPLDNKPYRLVVDGRRYDGKTDGNGLVEHKISPDASEGEIEIRYDDAHPEKFYKWTLRIGELDPLDELAGAQARLSNLGYAPGPIDGLMGPKTQAAIKAFQKDQGLNVSGMLCGQTIQKLLEHDLH